MMNTQFRHRTIQSAAIAIVLAAGAAPTLAQSEDAYGGLPSQIELRGVVRDFRERTVSGGHPDFELNVYGHYAQIVQDQLGEDGKPVFRSTGKKIQNNWRDSAGRNRIPPKEYILAMPGDVNGSWAKSSPADATDAAHFDMWYRDTAGTNVSAALPITLNRTEGTMQYVFDDRTDPFYTSRGGFFPINGELFGNSQGNDKNFHFTYELHTQFVFDQGGGQVFTFNGDDDVWVFVDGKLVIDIGGIHSRVTQTIDLDRLSWLEDGKMYNLDFFFAERHRTQSNFRIETTLNLRNVELPAVSGLYD